MMNKLKAVEVYLLIATLISVGVMSAVISVPQHQAKAMWSLGGCCRSFGGGSGGSTSGSNLNIQSQENSGNNAAGQ